MSLKKMFLIAFEITILVFCIRFVSIMIIQSKPVQKIINQNRSREIFVDFKKDATYSEIMEIPLIKNLQETSFFLNPRATAKVSSEKIENITQNLENDKKVSYISYDSPSNKINVSFLPEVGELEASQIMAKESLSIDKFSNISIKLYPIAESKVEFYIDELKKNPMVDDVHLWPLLESL